jgi:hypothetical protein
MFQRVLFSVSSTAIAVGCCVSFAATEGAGAAADCGMIQIISRALATGEAERYCKYAADERAKVEAYWGPTWEAPIRIHVDESHKISRALVPAFQGNRGLVEMPLRRARGNDGALLHEIVHVYAPSPNRFLAEGFAVYLQARLGGNRSLPNWGESLSSLARSRLPADGLMARLNKVRTPTPLRVVMDEMTAYLLAGSFVGFLIERYELPHFRRLYETEDYERVYGKSFQELEQEWRAHLERQ